MNKLEWKEICRKSKWAGKKKRLTKKELGGIMKGVVALNKIVTPKKENFQERLKEPVSIKSVLNSLILRR